MLSKKPQKSVRQAALDLLARREHSTTEISRKLHQKSYSLEEIALTIEALQKQGLLNNARFIENFIHHSQTKGLGPLRIRMELLQRGITEELIEPALNITDNTWLTEAYRVWQKRFKNKKSTDIKSRAQQMRFLLYRGFTREQIQRVLESHENVEEFVEN